jgi:hypothetical protein
MNFADPYASLMDWGKRRRFASSAPGFQVCPWRIASPQNVPIFALKSLRKATDAVAPSRPGNKGSGFVTLPSTPPGRTRRFGDWLTTWV